MVTLVGKIEERHIPCLEYDIEVEAKDLPLPAKGLSEGFREGKSMMSMNLTVLRPLDPSLSALTEDFLIELHGSFHDTALGKDETVEMRRSHDEHLEIAPLAAGTRSTAEPSRPR
jgi:hypothetical protein